MGDSRFNFGLEKRWRVPAAKPNALQLISQQKSRLPEGGYLRITYFACCCFGMSLHLIAEFRNSDLLLKPVSAGGGHHEQSCGALRKERKQPITVVNEHQMRIWDCKAHPFKSTLSLRRVYRKMRDSTVEVLHVCSNVMHVMQYSVHRGCSVRRGF